MSIALARPEIKGAPDPEPPADGCRCAADRPHHVGPARDGGAAADLVSQDDVEQAAYAALLTSDAYGTLAYVQAGLKQIDDALQDWLIEHGNGCDCDHCVYFDTPRDLEEVGRKVAAMQAAVGTAVLHASEAVMRRFAGKGGAP